MVQWLYERWGERKRERERERELLGYKSKRKAQVAEEEIGYSKRREGSCDLLPPLTYFLFKAKRPLVAYLQGREPPIFFFSLFQTLEQQVFCSKQINLLLNQLKTLISCIKTWAPTTNSHISTLLSQNQRVYIYIYIFIYTIIFQFTSHQLICTYSKFLFQNNFLINLGFFSTFFFLISYSILKGGKYLILFLKLIL